MKTQTETRDVQVEGVEDGWAFHLAMGPKIMELLSGQYTNLPLAVVREYLANMMDAYVGIPEEERITPELHLPTALEPWIEFKDYGVGMSMDTVRQVFTGYGVTTKDGDNDNHGGFGIGAKVMFAFMRAFKTADQWTVESRFEGQRMIFSATKDKHGMPFMHRLGIVPTDEPNGVTIRGPIPPSQFQHLAHEAAKLLRYFPMEVKLTGEQVTVEPVTYDMEGEGWGIQTRHGNSKVIIGGIAYPLDLEHLIRNQVLNPEARAVRFDLHVPVGSVDLVPSREGLEYTEQTMKALKDQVKVMDADLTRVANKEIEEASTPWQAMVMADRMSGNAFLKRVVHQVSWRGQVLDLNQGISFTVAEAKKLGLEVQKWVAHSGHCEITRHEALLDGEVIQLSLRQLKKTMLLLDDVERGTISRAKQALLDLHAPRDWNKRRNATWEDTVAWILVPADKRSRALKKLSPKLEKLTSGAPVRSLSEVEVATSGGGPRGEISLKVLTYNGVEHYSGEAKGVYVRLNGNSLVDYPSRDEARSLMSLGQSAGIIPAGAKLLGVPRSRSEVEAEAEMEELADALKEGVKVAMKELAQDRADYLEMDKISVDANLASLAEDLPDDHPVKVAVKGMKEGRDEVGNQIGKLDALVNRLRLPLKWDNPTPRVNAAQIQAVLDRYPMLSILDSYRVRYQKDGARKLAMDYIHLVDASLAQVQAPPRRGPQRKAHRKALSRQRRMARTG